ncbi:BON domain-containing protein [Winogradskyella sp. Asnod2-B02-A]|uniref:BON domain-containing protein n=1 Tax=Winogradskyella sp. Asnod2-B02-A TaxID=3160583 RepID=UPI0038654B9E
MKTDLEIKNNVLEELEWQPILKDAQLGVEVVDGITTLTGTVSNLAEKIAAENAVKSVKGVKAIVEKLNVKNDKNVTDKDVAKRIIDDLEWNASVEQEDINVKVEDGYVYLSGKVKWAYQKNEAEKSLEYIEGIKSITNDISVTEKTISNNVTHQINKAFKRSANIDAHNVSVIVEGNTATLQGTVKSIKEKDDALRAAYLADGITDVKNELKVEYDAIYM